MAKLKTQKTENSVDVFLQNLADSQKRDDALSLKTLMEEVTKAPAKLWGPSIIGFGDVHLKYESGRELDWFKIGFSPRKQNFALYLPGVVKGEDPLLAKLGSYKTGKGCLYITKLAEIDLKVLKALLKKSYLTKA